MGVDTSAAVSAVAACVQTGILVVAASIAFWQVLEARRIRKEQAQPYVVVSLETDPSSPHLIYLVVKNLGKTVARNIKIKFQPTIVSSLDREGSAPRITDWVAINEAIPTLAPNQSMRTLIDSAFNRFADDAPPAMKEKVLATVTYFGDRKADRPYKYEYDLDFKVFYGAHYVGRKNLDHLVKAMEGINASVKAWTTDDGIRVYTKTFDELKREQEAWLRERGLAPKTGKSDNEPECTDDTESTSRQD